ncbi:protein Brevis radix-like 4 [Lactuca sativa]|nr:protein Brevis radix-like 4 [Lactuca sativa]
MVTCVPRSKQTNKLDESNRNGDTNSSKQTAKTLASQIKDMALKASGAYRGCSPCTGPATMMTPQQLLQKTNDAESDASASVSDKFRQSYRRTGSKNSSSGRVWGKEMEARLKGISMGSGGGGEAVSGTLSASASGRRPEPIVLVDEIEPKEWVAQVEPGVLITFISLPRGGNDLKRIRFSREMFNKWQAQRWWQDNFDKVMELYNVQRLNRQAFPLPMPPRSEDELTLESRSSKPEFLDVDDSPLTPTLSKERLPRTLQHPTGFSLPLDHHNSNLPQVNHESSGQMVTPKLSTISGVKTETSSISASSSREADRSGELSISNVSDIENEWVEQDEPGVYITIRAFQGGSRELRRVRFSREKFGEVHARLWWEENRARIHSQYL